MGTVETQRTVVKSVPEIWAELSVPAALDRMLHTQFGEIRITRLSPESSIEWESDRAAGLVELEPSGFGTRVRLTAELASAASEPGTGVGVAPPGLGEAPPRRRSLFARLFRRPATPAATAEPPAYKPPPESDEEGLARGALTAVLDEIGAARHRPFSRDAGALPPIA